MSRSLPPARLALVVVLLLAGGAPPLVAEEEPEDLKDVPAEVVTLDEDAHKRYVRIGPVGEAEAPKKGHPLLVILPGGDGGEGFQFFCRRILKHACPEGWVAAQVIAPRFTKDQTLVWPTKELEVEAMAFTTQELVAAVIADASKWKDVDEDRIHLLGWSSSGPALWEMSVAKKPPAKRFFIAMSVFKEDRMPSRPRVKGRRWYLLHSPQDPVCPFRFVEAGKRYLEEAKAAVKLATYPGGHGWRGNVYGMIREGIDWLEHD